MAIQRDKLSNRSIRHPVSSIQRRVSRMVRLLMGVAAVSSSAMEASLELWLVRHGETTFSAGKRVAGWSDPPLTDNGRRQAEALREVIDGRRFVGVWSSDLQRAVDSARLAWGEPETDQRLRECDFGDLEGCTYEEADSTYVARSRRPVASRTRTSRIGYTALCNRSIRVATCSSSTAESSGC